MEQSWYYLDSNNESRGPLDLATLLQALRSSAAGGKTLVWTEGMSDWAEAESCQELLRILPGSRPPPPPRPRPSQPSTAAEVAEAPSGFPAATVHPWRRFFARQLDILAVAMVLGLVTGLLLEPDSPVDRVLNHNAVFGMLTVLILVPVEAVLLAVFGSTLGKVIYAISLTPDDHEPLGFGRAISRAFRVYLQGMALGIPLVSLITNYLGYRSLRKTGTTAWDQAGGLSVRHGRLSGLRIALIVLAWVVALGIIALGVYAKVQGL